MQDEARGFSEAFGQFIELHPDISNQNAVRIFAAYVRFYASEHPIPVNRDYPFAPRPMIEWFPFQDAINEFMAIGNQMIFEPSSTYEDIYQNYVRVRHESN